MTGKELRAAELAVRYRTERILDGLNLAFVPGSVTAIVGPNGSGKSTLVKALARLLTPDGGAVLLDGLALHGMSPRSVARELAVLPQAPTAPDILTVYELVEQGRFPHTGGLRRLGQV
ncbi:MAG: ABC transporter ATP-binding protein, partial [Pseudonocardiaceae bacterium]